MVAARRGDLSRARRPQLAFPVLLLCVLGFYALLRAPVFDSENYLDPWIYTAAFKNFGAMYRLFGETYYVTRLPWLIPGIAIHSVFPPVAGFFVLHILFYASAGGCAYLLFRHFYGGRVAIAASAGLMLSPLFYDSFSNDYPDGAVLTYLFGAAYFGLTAASVSRRAARLVAAGFFAAAAVGTNLFSAVVVAGLGLGYLVISSARPAWIARLPRDVAAAGVGAFLLLCACGAFSRAYGGPFLFFMPQWRFARTVDTAQWKLHGYAWLSHESQLLVPLIVLAFLVVALFARRRLFQARSDARTRAAFASALMLAYLVALIAIWEFAFTGDFLELTYYFTLFNIPVAFATASALDLLGFGERSLPFLATGSAIVAGLPLLLVYGFRVAPTASEGARVTVALIAAVVALAGVLVVVARRRARLWPVLGLGAALMLLFLPNYAAASGGSTAGVFQNGRDTFARRRAALTMALQLIDFVRGHRLQATAPNFWYDDTADPFLDGIQSTYLWGTTYIGRQMPTVAPELHKVLRNRRPEALVLLASSPERLTAGAEAIRALHYHLRLLARGELHAGSWTFGVRAYRIAEYYRGDAFSRYYGSLHATLEEPPPHRPIAQWSFARGLPSGWSKAPSLRVVRPTTAAGVFETSTRQWEYELMAPKQTLPPGRYAVYLQGRVRRGGIDVGILDVGSSRWLAQSTYWFRQRLDRGWMVVHLDLAKQAEVQVIFSNWVTPGSTSRWVLRQLRVVRLAS